MKKMKKKITVIISVLVLSMILTASIQAATTRITVIGFESEDLTWGDSSQKEELLENTAEMFDNKLTVVDNFNTTDRDVILAILDNPSFSIGNRPLHSIINQLSNIINTDLFAAGSLDQVDFEKIDEINLGPVKFTEFAITVDISVELIDAQRSHFSSTYTGSGSTTISGVNLDFDEDQELLEQAIEKALDEIIENIVNHQETKETEEKEDISLPDSEVIEAEIIAVVGNTLVINQGLQNGLTIDNTGNIFRITEDSQLLIVGKATVSAVDHTHSLLEAGDLQRTAKIGDIVTIPVTGTVPEPEEPPAEEPSEQPDETDIIQTLESNDFTVRIKKATKSGDRVTISGTAYAKNTAELEIILSNRDLYDHRGNRHDMSGRRVSLGGWTNSSSNVASLKDNIQQGETVNISWSFTGLPETSDKLSRIELWIRTSREGSLSIELQDLPLEDVSNE